jgi:hypothetical protein
MVSNKQLIENSVPFVLFTGTVFDLFIYGFNLHILFSLARYFPKMHFDQHAPIRTIAAILR